MKTRNGFVSNSSSSSFIVAFPKKPKTVEETFKMLFGEREKNEEIIYLDDYKITCGEVADRVFSDIKFQNSADIDLIAQIIRFRYVDDLETDYNKFSKICSDIWKWTKEEEVKICKKYNLVDTFSVQKNHKAWKEISNINKTQIKKEKVESEKYNKECKKYAKNFINKNKGKFFAIFEYGDENGETVLENGDVFSNLSNIRCNGH